MIRNRFFGLTVALTLCALLLGACGPATASPTTAGPSEPSESSPSEPSPADTTAAPPGDTVEALPEPVTLRVQTRDGVPIAEGGIIVRQGESYSFTSSGLLASQTAGYLQSIESATYTVGFRNPEGRPLALAEMQGRVQWNEEGRIVDGEESFLRLQVSSGEWFAVTEREVVDDRVVLVDDVGTRYTIVSVGPAFEGVMTVE